MRPNWLRRSTSATAAHGGQRACRSRAGSPAWGGAALSRKLPTVKLPAHWIRSWPQPVACGQRRARVRPGSNSRGTRPSHGSACPATNGDPGSAQRGTVGCTPAGLLVLVVHDVGYLLRQPFWTDEAWVAVTTRFPLSQLPATTSSTPIGWSALLRVVTVSRTQTGRLLPLGFAGAGRDDRLLVRAPDRLALAGRLGHRRCWPGLGCSSPRPCWCATT